MCKKNMLTEEQCTEKRANRKQKRSEFLTRMVDEFKKIILIVMYPTVVGFLIWEHIIYEKGVTPAFPSAVTVALITGLFGTIIAYCIASFKEKDSLNKNGLTKGTNGVIQKVAEVVSNVVASASATKKVDSDSDDSDAKG